MVLNFGVTSAWKKMKVSRVVLICGLLTFLFIVEFCIGLRNLYYIFSLWQSSSRIPSNNQTVSWTLCVACLLLCVVSSLTVSLISAMWEQKQMTENGEEKNPIRFALHVFVSGMVWRYVSLWFADNKKLQKKQALLLTFLKFFFTQFFTIPMVIVHANSSETLEEVIYDLCSVLCISANLILTCIVFTWCKAEVIELKKWNFETVDLIPLIFCQSSEDTQPPDVADQRNSDSKNNVVANNNPSTCCDQTDDNIEPALVRIIVLFQTFCFTFGRLLALGILLKLAGIYALTILFLQLLISVVYLKFQVPFLVSDSLPKWRQLTRLAFMSYILIFEWHLNRDPKTGYDFTSNIKHSMLYYFIATLESVFYFITWAITEAYAASSSFNTNVQKQKFSRNVIIIGILSLMFSLIVHFLLLFWQSRRLSAFIHSVQRRYLKSKLRIVNSVRNRNKSKSKALETNTSQPEISDPIPMCDSSNGCHTDIENPSPLQKRSSYKDLREPIDEEIEIYARKNKNLNNSESTDGKKNEDVPVTKRELHSKSGNTTSSVEETPNKDLKKRIKSPEVGLEITPNPEDITENKVNKRAYMAKDSCITVISKNDSNLNHAQSDAKLNENSTVSVTNAASKTKIVQLSESINERWSKFSSIPKKFTGTMRHQIQKRKEQFNNFRKPLGEKSTDVQHQNAEEHCSVEETSNGNNVSAATEDNVKVATEDNVKVATEDNVKVAENNESSEAYFLGDPRGYDEEEYYSGEEAVSIDDNTNIDDRKQGLRRRSSTSDSSEEANQQEPSHIDGDDSCPCHLCRPEGRMLRRRSSSVPAVDGKLRQHFLSSMIADDLPKESSMVRCPSSPNIVRVDMRQETDSGSDVETSDACLPPSVYLKGRSQNLSIFASDDRVEHYV